MKNNNFNMQEVLNALNDKSVIWFRSNGRTWHFSPNDKITCFDGLKSIDTSVFTDELLNLLLFDFETLKSVLPFER